MNIIDTLAQPKLSARRKSLTFSYFDLSKEDDHGKWMEGTYSLSVKL